MCRGQSKEAQACFGNQKTKCTSPQFSDVHLSQVVSSAIASILGNTSEYSVASKTLTVKPISSKLLNILISVSLQQPLSALQLAVHGS